MTFTGTLAEKIAKDYAKKSPYFDRKEPDLCIFSLEDIEAAVQLGLDAGRKLIR